MSEQFYITLPSKASQSDFPTNSPGNYKVRMPNTVKLNGPYEVALATITYPLSFYNVPLSRNTFSIIYGGKEHKLTIDEGYYTTISDITAAMNKVMGDVKYEVSEEKSKYLSQLVQFRYNPRNGSTRFRAKFVNMTPQVKFTDPSVLGIMLGFRSNVEIPGTYPDEWHIVETTWRDVASSTFARESDDVDTIKDIYVYCNVINHSIVGSSSVPLLRSITAKEGKFGERVVKEFNKYDYMKVAVDEFNSIEIVLCDNAGQQIAFLAGEVVTKLHFRPISRFRGH